MSYLLNTYARLPISFDYAKNVWLFDYDGNRYLDLVSGMGVMMLGHAHPKILYTITAQSTKLSHIYNLVQIPEQELLAEQLSMLSGLSSNNKPHNSKVFFCNSGAEAVEAAIKLTRLYGHSKNITNPKVITMKNGYHGRTLAALSASDIPAFQQKFAPLVDSFIKIPFNDVPALQDTLNSAEAKDIVAVILEPIQGAAGVNIPDINYLTEIRKICTKHNLLMMVDEIQTGIGRTGKLFCYQHSNVIPDVVIAAKGLANGIPIGTIIIQQPWADLFIPSSHGSTFGGNPLACSVATATLNEIKQHNLCQSSEQLGNYFLNQLQQELSKPQYHNHIVDIRGQGLMIAIELDKPCQSIMQLALKYGLLCNVTNSNVIRILPPLIIEQQHIDFAVEKIALTIQEFYS